MRIERWFQSVGVCGGNRPGFGYTDEPGSVMPQCLFTQACWDRLDVDAIARLAAVIERHFPARSWCDRCEWSPISRLIHFNNAEATTREDVDKVLLIFTEEQERG